MLAFQYLEPWAKALVDIPGSRLLGHKVLQVQWMAGCHQDHLQKKEGGMEGAQSMTFTVLTERCTPNHGRLLLCISLGQDCHEVYTEHLSNTLPSASHSCTHWSLWNYFCAVSVSRFNSHWKQNLLGEAYFHVVRYNHVNTPLNIPPCSAIKFWNSSLASSLKCLDVIFFVAAPVANLKLLILIFLTGVRCQFSASVNLLPVCREQ